MKIFKMVHTILFYLVVVVSFLIGTTITLVISWFSKDKIKPFQTAAHLWARFLVPFSLVKFTIAGVENLPKTPAIYVANHQGAADILMLLAGIPNRFLFAIKKELFKIPFFGWYLKKAGYFSIDRKVVLSAYKTLQVMVDIMKKGSSVMIFPEGTRSFDGKVGEFKRGSLLAAFKANVSLVPIAINGSCNVMPRGSWLINPCPVKLTVGKPIDISKHRKDGKEDYDGATKEVRDAIVAMM